MPDFTIVERDGKCVATAALIPYADPNMTCAEVGAFAVHPRYRGAGRGDSLLDYLEYRARAQGISRLFLLTTRTADWFEQRGFRPAGRAFGNPLLPSGKKVDAARNSKLYIKLLDDSDKTPGSRPAIGAHISFSNSMGAVMASGRGLSGASVAGGGMTGGLVDEQGEEGEQTTGGVNGKSGLAAVNATPARNR